MLADSDLFGDDCIGELDNESPVAEPRLLGRAAGLRRRPGRRRFARPRRPRWAELKAAVEELRLTQEPDGSVDLSAHDAGRLAELVATISKAARA